jgi:multidrug resistance efflux pump
MTRNCSLHIPSEKPSKGAEMTDNNTIMNKRARLKQRQEQAAERKAAREARTDKEQLEILYNRGINCGREWDRLVARIEAAEPAVKKGHKR